MDYIALEDVRRVVLKLESEPAYQHEDEDFGVGVATLSQEIEDLPRKQFKKGYWKGKQMQRWIYAECSECGTVHDVPSNFCPSCGVEMISKELKIAPENSIKFAGMINGCPAFIGTQALEFNNERAIEKRLDNNEGIAFIKLANLEGFATYGVEQTREYEWGHGPGYIWSSRATVMNRVFDVALVDALYKTENSSTYRCCAIDLVHLMELLEGTEYEVSSEPRATDEDVHYDVKKRV